MGALSQHAVDEKMVNQLATFIKVGDKAGIFRSPGGKALRDEIAKWVPEMTAALNPAGVSAQHRAKIAPQLAVFTHTHDLVVVLALLFEGWGRLRGNEVEIEAAIGPMRVGEDEQEDAQKLHAWQPYFAKVFGAAGLPAELRDEPVKKQLAAHAAAREELPGTSDGQVFRAAQSTKKGLRAAGLGYWERMHSMLDAEFGKGPEAFASKSMFGYERRLRGSGPSKKKRAGDGPPAAPEAGGEKILAAQDTAKKTDAAAS